MGTKQAYNLDLQWHHQLAQPCKSLHLKGLMVEAACLAWFTVSAGHTDLLTFDN